MSALRIDGELSIYRAAELHPVLLAAAEQAGPDDGVELDLGAVVECDSAGVQLLLALARSLRERGGALRIGAASDSVRDVLALLGLERELGLGETA